jgi:hypothetical protein
MYSRGCAIAFATICGIDRTANIGTSGSRSRKIPRIGSIKPPASPRLFATIDMNDTGHCACARYNVGAAAVAGPNSLTSPATPTIAPPA